MSDDEFDELRWESRRMEADHLRDRDQQLSILREIWDACSVQEQNELKSILYTLDIGRGRLGRITGWRLQAPCLSTWNFNSAPEELVNEHPLNEILSKTPEIFISFAEMLCAISCWENKKDYVPLQIGLISNHPRWPFRRNK